MSLAEMYVEHGPAARATALALAPAQDAADLVAESFTRVAAAMNAGRQVADPGRYWKAAVRHQAADRHRAAARAVPVADPEPPPAPPADTAVLAADEAGRVRAAYRELPPRWRDVLWDTEVERLPPRALAERYGTSPAGVAQLAARARDALRTAWLAQHAPCKDHAAALAARARGQLGHRAGVRLDAHLARCGRCRAAEGELSALAPRLGAVLVAALAARVARHGLRLGLRPVAWAAAAMVAAGGTGLLPYSRPALAPPLPPAQASVVPAAAAPRPVLPVAVTPRAATAPYRPRHARTPAPAANAAARPAPARPRAAAGAGVTVPATPPPPVAGPPPPAGGGGGTGDTGDTGAVGGGPVTGPAGDGGWDAPGQAGGWGPGGGWPGRDCWPAEPAASVAGAV